jgi:hypothetical protein
MKILDHIGAQGELRIYKIDALPEGIGTNSPERTESGAFIISHSEKGHHHVLGGNVDVIEHEETIQFGTQSVAMRTLYAIVREPTALHQTATDNHDDIMLAPGDYMIRADIEYDPFGEELRQVCD